MVTIRTFHLENRKILVTIRTFHLENRKILVTIRTFHLENRKILVTTRTFLSCNPTVFGHRLLLRLLKPVVSWDRVLLCHPQQSV